MGRKRRNLKDGHQVRVVFPPHLFEMLEGEAQQAGVTMADLVRLAVKERYERQAALQSPPLPEGMVTP